MILPPFQERNPHLLKEALVLLNRKQVFVGASTSGTRFYGLGSFHSDYLKRDVYGGIKIIKGIEKDYFCNSLASILLLDERCPQARNFLPLFFGGLEDTFHIVMEDFSQNRSAPVFDMHDYSQIPDEIKRFMIIEGKNELLRAFIDINGSDIKMMDFDTIPWEDSYYKTSSYMAFNLHSEKEKIAPYLIKK